MAEINRLSFAVLLTVLVLAGMIPAKTAAAPIAANLQSDEAVETIRVELLVAAGGEDLNEPIARDLGLGFPLWLHRLGRIEDANAPFGAVPQIGTDAHAIRTGQRASFQFSTTGPDGQDDLNTSAQLLSGVHISDISRIGLASKGEGGWVIEGYTLDINGRVFSSNGAINAKGREIQNAARARLAEIEKTISPQQDELQSIQALVSIGLANSSEKSRLSELRDSLAPFQAEDAGVLCHPRSCAGRSRSDQPVEEKQRAKLLPTCHSRRR